MEEDSGLVLSFTFVMENIFKTCDRDQNDAVPASTLIDYMKPFMLNHSAGIALLQFILDPKNENPIVDKTSFFEAMRKWRKIIDQKDTKLTNFSMTSITKAEEIEENDTPIPQSAPRKNFDCNDGMDISNFVTNEYIFHDKNPLKEDYNELQHKYRNVLNEISSVKLQLITNEEQFIELKMEHEETKLKLKIEQQLVTELQKSLQFKDNLIEEQLKDSEALAELKEMFSILKKENANLLKKIKNNDIEREQSEDELIQKNEKIEEEYSNLKNLLIAMQSEMDHLKMEKLNQKDGNNKQKEEMKGDGQNNFDFRIERLNIMDSVNENHDSKSDSAQSLNIELLNNEIPYKNLYHPANFKREIFIRKSIRSIEKQHKSVQTESSLVVESVDIEQSHEKLNEIVQLKEANERNELTKKRTNAYINSLKSYKNIADQYICKFDNQILFQMGKIQNIAESQKEIVRFMNELRTDLCTSKVEFDSTMNKVWAQKKKTDDELSQVYKEISDLKNELFDEETNIGSTDPIFEVSISNLQKVQIKMREIKYDDIMKGMFINELLEKIDILEKNKKQTQELHAKLMHKDKIVSTLKRYLTQSKIQIRENMRLIEKFEIVLLKQNADFSTLRKNLALSEQQRKHLLVNNKEQMINIEKKIKKTEECEKAMRQHIEQQNLQIKTLQTRLKNSTQREDAFEKSLLKQKNSVEDLKNVLVKYEKELILKENMMKEQEIRIDNLKRDLSTITLLSEKMDSFRGEMKEKEFLLNSSENMLEKTCDDLEKAENRIMTMKLLLDKCEMVIFGSARDVVREIKKFVRKNILDPSEDSADLEEETFQVDFNEAEIWKIHEALVSSQKLLLKLMNEDAFRIPKLVQGKEDQDKDLHKEEESQNSSRRYVKSSDMVMVISIVLVLFLLLVFAQGFFSSE